MIQLDPVLAVIVIAGPGWSGPTGRGMAIFFTDDHAESSQEWTVVMDETGEPWAVPNRFIRFPRNVTWGRNPK